jgi:magnesium-transporting ATPase (P-type)
VAARPGSGGAVIPAAEEVAWHALPAAGALLRAGGDAARGLDPAEAARRLAAAGPNALPGPVRASALAVLLRQFRSPLIYLLLVAAAVSVAAGERGDAAVILAVLLVNAGIGAFQEGRAERSMEALRRLAAPRGRVLRGGEAVEIPAREVVPGDLLLLAAGDAVAADARLVEAASLAVSEAALTGESLPSAKATAPLPPGVSLGDRTNLVFAGTHVTAGRGRAVVIATGPWTEVGRIAALATAAEEPETPLARRVRALGRALTFAAVGIFAAVLAAGLARGLPFTAMLMVAVSQLVSTVPEGLPVALTVALAVGMQRMAQRRAVVRRLAAVETLGSATTLCVDKTGTLTRNEMTVVRAVLGAPGGRLRWVDFSGAGYAPAGAVSEAGAVVDAAGDPGLRALLAAGALCNDAALEPPAGPGAPWRAAGDPTEIALLTAAAKAGLDPAALRATAPRTAELPFDAEARLMATWHGGGAGPGRVVVKGAPERVLELCRAARAGAGEAPLDAGARAAWLAASEGLAADALRVLGVAEGEGRAASEGAGADGEGSGAGAGFDALRGRLVLLGLSGQLDPPRPEVPAAIAECRGAGIRVVMVTGDQLATGVAVARRVGLAGEGDLALDGRAMETLEAEALASGAARTAVFARVQPSQKLRIVEALQARGEVVAMTGDGVNDAPALVRADVGVALGRSGTEVAKEASDVVLADDHFATLVDAVAEGRLVHANVRKILLLLLSTGLAEATVLLAALLVGLPLPFIALQILWNNVVTEGTITVNLALEPREGDELRRPPLARDAPLLDRALLRRTALLGAAIVAAVLGYYVLLLGRGLPVEHARTGAFTLLAVCEWFNVLNVRSEARSALGYGLARNRWLLGGLALSVLLQAAVIWARPLGRLFQTVPLSAREVLEIAVLGSAVLWVDELRKLRARRATRA